MSPTGGTFYSDESPLCFLRLEAVVLERFLLELRISFSHFKVFETFKDKISLIKSLQKIKATHAETI